MGAPRDSDGPRAPSRLVGIDVLRGLAALAVVVTHLPFSWQGGLEQEPAGSALPWAAVAVTHYGQYGVHLFLVISGFCIHMQWARRGRDDESLAFGSFWKRRLRRLYPPYFVALLCSIAGLALVARLSGTSGSSIGSFFGYSSTSQFVVDLVLLVLLAQNLNGASGRVGNGPFWSLALEEQLYAMYFPLLAMRRRWGWRMALVVVIAVTLGWRTVLAFAEHPPEFWGWVGPARWLDWVLGAVAVEAHLGRLTLPRWLSRPWVALLSFGVGVAIAPPFAAWPVVPATRLVNDAVFSFASFVMVNWVCGTERTGGFGRGRLTGVLARVGVMSYSLYLVHHPVMVVTKRVAISAGLHSVPTILALRIGVSLLAAYVFFRVVESRFLNASRGSAARAVRATASESLRPNG